MASTAVRLVKVLLFCLLANGCASSAPQPLAGVDDGEYRASDPEQVSQEQAPHDNTTDELQLSLRGVSSVAVNEYTVALVLNYSSHIAQMDLRSAYLRTVMSLAPDQYFEAESDRGMQVPLAAVKPMSEMEMLKAPTELKGEPRSRLVYLVVALGPEEGPRLRKLRLRPFPVGRDPALFTGAKRIVCDEAWVDVVRAE